MKQIITIGRQYGSGGHEIGQKLAKELSLKCYDKEILQAAARKMDIAPAVLAKSEEANTSLLYSLLMSAGTNSAEDQMAKYEAKFLRQQAEKGSCVIVGRCGGYVFRDDPALISFYITAPIEKRIERIMRLYHLSEEEALKKIQNTDKKRASYYYYHTDKKWTDLSQYQFVIDSSVFGTEGTVELMEHIVRMRSGV